MKINIIIFSHVCFSSLLRVSWCVWCSMSFLFEYMCTRLPFISWSIAGVPSSHPGYLITAPPSVCIPDVIGTLAVWWHNSKNKTKLEARANISTKKLEKKRAHSTPTTPDVIGVLAVCRHRPPKNQKLPPWHWPATCYWRTIYTCLFESSLFLTYTLSLSISRALSLSLALTRSLPLTLSLSLRVCYLKHGNAYKSR
jgi:hypothetical protein